MVVSSLMLVVTAVFFCTLGIFFSSFMKRTLTATVSSYGAILGSFLFLVILFLVIELTNRASSNLGPVREYLLTILVWFIISTNPFLAAIGSEAILVDDQSLFITYESLFGHNSYYLLSPWTIYVTFYVVLTIFMIFLSIQRVKRPDH
jgi:ABC-2 type transport system permease protein